LDARQQQRIYRFWINRAVEIHHSPNAALRRYHRPEDVPDLIAVHLRIRASWYL
jgi:hypothetical protein